MPTEETPEFRRAMPPHVFLTQDSYRRPEILTRSSVVGPLVFLLISRAAATPTLRAYQSALQAAGISGRAGQTQSVSECDTDVAHAELSAADKGTEQLHILVKSRESRLR